MISVGFSMRPRNILSRFIRWVTKSSCSHVWLLVDSETFGTSCVLEATEVGIRLIPLSNYIAKGNYVVELVEVSHDLSPGLKEMSKMLGEKYDFTGLFGMAWVYLGRLFKKRWKNPTNSSEAMFCSEFVAHVLRASSHPDFIDADPASLSPQDLLRLLKSK